MFKYKINQIKSEIIASKALPCVVCRKYDDIFSMPTGFEDSCDSLLWYANQVLTGTMDELSLEVAEISSLISAISTALTIAGENPEKHLPKTWSELSYTKEILDYTYYALACIDSVYSKRAEVGYILDRNKIELGVSGFSTKLNKHLPYYITTFDGSLFIINPIKGEVLKSIQKFENLDLLRLDNRTELWLGGRKLLYVNKNGLELLIACQVYSKDMKKTEKAKKVEEGKKVKDTKWLSTFLGYLKGKNTYIRSHTLIALMVYGYEFVKYALMDANSILTIDHIDSIHSNNGVDNLALVSRKANNQKKGSDLKIFDYSLYFLGLDQTKEEVKEEVKETVEVQGKDLSTLVAEMTRPLTFEEIQALAFSK